jgi:aspartate racemase
LHRLAVPPGPIGVMGTAATLAMRLYQTGLEAHGWTCLVPTEAEMQTLVSPAIAAVKANRVADAYAPLAEVATRLVGRGGQAVVLGCTEIPLGMQAGPALPFPVADSIDALARAAIRWAGVA